MEIPNEAKIAIKTAFDIAGSAEVLIDSQRKYETAASMRIKLKTKIGELDSLRRSITKPLDTAKKTVMDLFREPIERLDFLEGKIKISMIHYRQKIEEAKQLAEKRMILEKAELEKQAVAAIEKGDLDTMHQKIQLADKVYYDKPVFYEAENTSMRTIWKWKVVDEMAIPREYLMIDEKKLNEAARTLKEQASVPGVEFYTRDTIVSRTGGKE